MSSDFLLPSPPCNTVIPLLQASLLEPSHRIKGFNFLWYNKMVAFRHQGAVNQTICGDDVMINSCGKLLLQLGTFLTHTRSVAIKVKWLHSGMIKELLTRRPMETM